MQHLGPVVVGRERGHAKLARQRQDPVLGRPGPLASHLDDLAVADRVADDPPAARTITDRPASARARAAVRPARPAPTTMTSTVVIICRLLSSGRIATGATAGRYGDGRR